MSLEPFPPSCVLIQLCAWIYLPPRYTSQTWEQTRYILSNPSTYHSGFIPNIPGTHCLPPLCSPPQASAVLAWMIMFQSGTESSPCLTPRWPSQLLGKDTFLTRMSRPEGVDPASSVLSLSHRPQHQLFLLPGTLCSSILTAHFTSLLPEALLSGHPKKL
jgi:hypothetical protein